MKNTKTKKMTKCSPAISHFPSPILKNAKLLSDDSKIEKIKYHFTEILKVLELDINHASISETPKRVAEMYVKEVFSGLNEKNFPEIKLFNNEFHHEDERNMVFVKVGFTSFCEHHFVPMKGTAYVAFLPGKHLIGLSKIPRIVRFFAHRPQLQERLTAQIADSLAILLEIDDVAVSIDAHHYCVIARGIEDDNGNMITNVLRGQFNTNALIRHEFFEGINRRK